MTSYTCRCCGYKTLSEGGGGSYEICPICFWEDDSVQNAYNDYPGGANKVSLREAQRNFREFGASEPEMLPHVRKPTEEDELDPDFKPLEYSAEDAKRWGERLAIYVDNLHTRLGNFDESGERYAWTVLAAQNFLTECELAYREYKYPEHNDERFHDLRIPIDPYEAHAWAQNQLTNWLGVRGQKRGE